MISRLCRSLFAVVAVVSLPTVVLSEPVLQGKGVFIKNLRSWKTDAFDNSGTTPRALKEPGVDRHLAYMYQDIADRKNGTNLPPGQSQSEYASMPVLPPPAGHVEVTIKRPGQPDVMARDESYTNDQIFKYLKDLGTSWVAVKAIEGKEKLSQWDENLVNAADKYDIKLFAYQTLTFDVPGGDQADALFNIYNNGKDATKENDHSIRPDGFIVMPVHNDDYNQKRSQPLPGKNKGGIAKEFCNTLRTKYKKTMLSNTTLIYSPPIDAHTINKNKDELDLHKTLYGGPLYKNKIFSAVMPRFYWGALPRLDQKQRVIGNVNRITELGRGWLSDSNTQLNEFEVPFIPIGQAQFYARDPNLIQDFTVIPEFMDSLSQYSTYAALTPAVGFWCFDSFTPSDEVAYKNCAWNPLLFSKTNSLKDKEFKNVLKKFRAIFPCPPTTATKDKLVDPSECLPMDNNHPCDDELSAGSQKPGAD